MAYGKIKADAIIYDNSGSDVERTIASLATAAPTASPTFTGDVTLTGASYNVVFDASDNALEFADNAKASFGNGGDFKIFHNGSNNYIDVEGDGVLYVRPKANFYVQNYTTGEVSIEAVPDGSTKLYYNGVEKIGTTNVGVTVTGTVTDTKGELRTIPQLSKSSAHTIVAGDAGQHSFNSSGGWVINTSTGFSAGQAITLINNSGSDQTVTNTGCTMYLANDTTAKSSLTLKGRGMATFICTGSNVYYGSGAGLE